MPTKPRVFGQKRADARRFDPNPRDKTGQRGYDAAWQRLRKAFLSANPLCKACSPKVTPAVVVHHIKPVESRPDLRLDWDNLMALCRDCHERIHGRLGKIDKNG